MNKSSIYSTTLPTYTYGAIARASLENRSKLSINLGYYISSCSIAEAQSGLNKRSYQKQIIVFEISCQI